MSALDAATWLTKIGSCENVNTLRDRIAKAFRTYPTATITIPAAESDAPFTLTFTHLSESDFYEVIQHHHVISYALDPKWQTLVENPSILPEFISIDELPWVAEFKEFYGVE